MKEDIRSGSGKTLDARKKQPKAAGTSAWNPTMLKGEKGSAGTPVGDSKHVKSPHDIKGNPEGTLDPRKKTAKPAGTTGFTPTMI
jgi:hypothetical protein